MENKIIEETQPDVDEIHRDLEDDSEDFDTIEGYMKILQKQREFCEKHGLKTAKIYFDKERNTFKIEEP